MLPYYAAIIDSSYPAPTSNAMLPLFATCSPAIHHNYAAATYAVVAGHISRCCPLVITYQSGAFFRQKVPSADRSVIKVLHINS